MCVHTLCSSLLNVNSSLCIVVLYWWFVIVWCGFIVKYAAYSYWRFIMLCCVFILWVHHYICCSSNHYRPHGRSFVPDRLDHGQIFERRTRRRCVYYHNHFPSIHFQSTLISQQIITNPFYVIIKT